MKRLLPLLLTPAITAGCAHLTHLKSTEGVRIDKALVLELKPGATSRKEVVERFGEPAEVSGDETGERFIYIFKETITPSYFGVIENEAAARRVKTTLEVVLKGDTVNSYRFDSTEE